MSSARARLVWITALVLLAACGRPTPVPLAPEEIVQRAAARMKALRRFHFAIDRSGAPAYLDIEETISFRRAEGDFVSPDQARATVRVITPGLVSEMRMISLGERYWETNLLSGEWQALPSSMGFNPAALFDPQIGFQPILEADLQALALAGVEELDTRPGQPNYALTGELAGERLYELSYGMIGPEVVAVQLWVAAETFEINRLLITEADPAGGEPTTWQIDFWGFDEEIEITPPELPDS